MGVSAKKLVYDFRRKHNAVLSGTNSNVAVVDIIAYLNEAQEIWFQNRVSVADTNQKVRNDLRAFKESEVKATLDKNVDGKLFYKYPVGLYHRLNHYVVAEGTTCCEGVTKEFSFDILESDDIHESRKDVYNKADFAYEQLPAVESKEGLILYTDGSFNVRDLILTYYRKPGEIHAPSLDTCQDDKGFYYDYNGRVIRQDQPFESDDTFASNIIVDIAVLCSLRDIGNTQSFQTQVNKILTNQQLEK